MTSVPLLSAAFAACALGAVCVGLACCAMVVRHRFVVVTVHGSSMEPTLHGGDRLLVRLNTVPGRGQLVVAARPAFTPGPDGATRPEFRHGADAWLIKRVAAVPADPAPGGGPVPAGQWVLLGDNRAHSLDSRQIGYFPTDALLGVVVRRLTRVAGWRHGTTTQVTRGEATGHQVGHGPPFTGEHAIS
ncbi:S26 family signal peptidase [Streptomyces sp. NPDC005009]